MECVLIFFIVLATGAPYMDPVFFPEGQQISRHLWTEGDRNMSEFYIYAFSNFSWYGNPTPKNILGVHWDMATDGEILKYLAVNTTENSTTLWNYRQRECAFWTEYLPTVVGYITPTYPPTTEFWWEPDSPIQVAFWSMSSACLVLLVLVVVCCLLWRNAKRQSQDRYFDGTESLKGFPTSQASDFVGKHFSETGSLHKNDFDASDLASQQQQMMGSRLFQQPPPSQVNGGSMIGLAALPPQTPIAMSAASPSVSGGHQMGGHNQASFQTAFQVNPNMGMVSSTHTLNAIHPMQQQQPQAYILPTPMTTYPSNQPLPMTPKLVNRPVQPLPPLAPSGSGIQREMSSDNLVASMQQRSATPTGSINQGWHPQQSAQQQQHQRLVPSKNIQNSPSSEHTSGRGTNESNSEGSSYGGGGMGRATPPLKPMGLPKSDGKLVPGRMSSQGGRGDAISSTAV